MPDDEDEEILACPDNTCIFLISNVQYFLAAVAFSISKPFKSPIYTNYFLTGFMILALVYSAIIILWPSQFVCNLLQLYNFDNPSESFYDDRRTDYETKEQKEKEYYIFNNPKIKYYVFGLAVLNFIVALIFERLIIPAFSAIWDMRKLDKLRLRKLNESENNLTMQELFKLTEKE